MTGKVSSVFDGNSKQSYLKILFCYAVRSIINWQHQYCSKGRKRRSDMKIVKQKLHDLILYSFRRLEGGH